MWFQGRPKIVGRKAAGGGAVLDLNIGRRYDNAAFETFKLDMDLYAVELQGCEGESLPRVLRKPKGQGHIQDSALTGIADQLSSCVTLTNHFRETTTRIARELLPHEQEVVVQRIHR